MVMNKATTYTENGDEQGINSYTDNSGEQVNAFTENGGEQVNNLYNGGEQVNNLYRKWW